MKGLLIKDFYMIKKQCYSSFIFSAFFLVLFVFIQTNIFPLLFSVIFISATLVNLLYYDEYYKWNILELTMPISRRTIVTEKYLILTIFLVPTILITSIIYLFVSKNAFETITILYTLFAVGFIIPTISLPFYYKLGYGKSKLMTMFVSAIIGGISAFSSINLKQDKTEAIISSIPNLFYFVFPIIIIAIILISYLISVKVYSKREF